MLDAVGAGPDVAVLFVTAPYLDHLDDVVAAVRSVLAPRILIGSASPSIIGNAREVEQRPALSLWAGHVEGATPVRMRARRHAGDWKVAGAPGDQHDGAMVLVADPHSFPVAGVLPQLRARSPELTVVGGLIAAAPTPGASRMVLDGTVHDGGAVGFLVPPGAVDVVVSQACRPIGEPFIVTEVERNVVLGLGGHAATERLRALLRDLDEQTAALAVEGLHVGVVVDESRMDFDRGDFLIRAVTDLDAERGGVVIAAPVSVGQTLQFQVRDARTASEDLRSQLQDRRAAGALLFACSGRGSQLFDEPDHDASAAHELLGAPPLAGAFCKGEIGPVGAENHVHALSAALALFR